MTYALYTYHDGCARPVYRMMSSDYDYLVNLGAEWVRLNGCSDYSVETLET